MPDDSYADPYAGCREVLVFTGAMDYWPNIDAVTWFAQEVLPLIRDSIATARFAIVGARPSREVRALASLPGVTVTGGVRDIRPYLAHARAVVAPLRVARGVQNKVLEAMAMARPVVATAVAVEGIDIAGNDGLEVADSRHGFAEKTLRFLDTSGPDSFMSSRRWVCSRGHQAHGFEHCGVHNLGPFPRQRGRVGDATSRRGVLLKSPSCADRMCRPYMQTVEKSVTNCCHCSCADRWAIPTALEYSSSRIQKSWHLTAEHMLWYCHSWRI